MARRKTQKEFEHDFYKKFGNKYDLSKFVYHNNKTKGIVICRKHGEFLMKPNDLLNGYGCPVCGGTKKLTTDEFIEKANYVHNGYFSYDKTIFETVNNKVIVTCPIHGDFEVKANNHLNGANCKLCQKDGISHKISKLSKINASTLHLSKDDFIKKCKEIHPEYDYGETDFLNYKTHVKVKCLKHGTFMALPGHFLNGQGCPYCGREKTLSSIKLSKDEFVERANTVHNNRYDYSKTNFENVFSKSAIICPIHGGFQQVINDHLNGVGCPKCNMSHLERDVMNFLDRHNIEYEYQKKFDWLGKQSLDFYLPKYNIAIECQGIQHFKPINIFGGKNGLEKVKQNDAFKNELCKSYGINILYYSTLDIKFPYKVYKDINDLFKNK